MNSWSSLHGCNRLTIVTMRWNLLELLRHRRPPSNSASMQVFWSCWVMPWFFMVHPAHFYPPRPSEITTLSISSISSWKLFFRRSLHQVREKTSPANGANLQHRIAPNLLAGEICHLTKRWKHRGWGTLLPPAYCCTKNCGKNNQDHMIFLIWFQKMPPFQ